MLAELLLDGKIVGRQPREAIRALLRSFDLDARIRAAGLLVDYHQQVEHGQVFTGKLSDGAAAGEPGAGLALARLQLSDNPQFRDEEGARAVLKILAEQGDRAALLALRIDAIRQSRTRPVPSRTAARTASATRN